MKVLFFTKYTRIGASSRLRTFQYLDYFEANGLECTVSPFFNDRYLREVYKHKRHNKWLSAISFSRRLLYLLQIWRYHYVIIEKELFPYFPAVFERILAFFGVRFGVDYDDAIFHNYDTSDSFVIRSLLKRKIETVMKQAAHVTVGNQYIAQKARFSNARKIVLLPTVIDTTKYTVKEYTDTKEFVIGWIGSPITQKYLGALKPVFAKLAEKYPIKLHLIGAASGIGLHGVEKLIAWNEVNEANEIRQFNVGIMPLEDNIWERGKCGYKLIQYMGSGVPVIGTPLGVNDEIIIDDWNGYKANTIDEWINAIEKLITGGTELEQKLGMNGRALVEQKYSLQVARETYLKLILDQAGNKKK
jgi:Glycosyltransferase